MEANTCDVNPPDGSYSSLSCRAIINNIMYWFLLGEAPNKICTAEWLSATSQTDGWCTDNNYHSGSYNTSNWLWCKCLKAADQTMDHSETWTGEKYARWKETSWKIKVCREFLLKKLILIKTRHVLLVENTWRCHIFITTAWILQWDALF